jgi:hypothetical protein
MAKKKDREEKAVKAIEKAVKKALHKGVAESIIQQTMTKALERVDGEAGAAPVNKVSKPKANGAAKRPAKAKKSADVVRHPPRSGWLDELGRLKGGWSAEFGVARCAPHRLIQNCPPAPSAASCSRM